MELTELRQGAEKLGYKLMRGCINPPGTCVRCAYNMGNNECNVKMMMADAADAIEKLQAEVKRLKECNDELREAQTYIDHYGDKWLTSAKDVPTSAYNHGYMDGRNEAMAKMEAQE